jgi:phosphoserine phosphatase RsbU/P
MPYSANVRDLRERSNEELMTRTPTLLDLEDIQNDETGRSYWLVGVEGKLRLPINSPILVGRGPYNHVVIDDTRVSWQHARIAPQRDGLVIYDLNSTNGTMVNGETVTRQTLKANDVVCFGSRAFRIESSKANQRTELTRFDPEGATIGEMAPFAVRDALEEEVLPVPASTAELPAVDLNQLEDAYRKLGTLYSFMQAICKTIDKRELLALIGTKMREVYPQSSVGIYLRAPHGTDERAFQLAQWAGARTAQPAVVLSDDVSRLVLEARRAILTESGMYAPMIDRDEALGVIHVARHDDGRSFSHPDLDLLSGMAAPAALILQNTRMHEDSLLRDRLKYDLELAEEIQRSFLPREVISVDGIELFAEYRAAYGVGGDFYDVFWVGPDRLGVFIGDISGKGVSAALIMARTSTELRAAALSLVDPVAVLTAMNSSLIARQQPEMFFTGIYFTMNVKTGEVLLANAGHPPPYRIRSDGTLEPITDGAACAVGILDDAGFEATTFWLAEGDTLVLYTDGIIEAPNTSGELYGEARLEACLALAGTRPNQIAQDILRSVDEHATDVTVRDDLTLFICQRSVLSRMSLQPRHRNSAAGVVK